MVSRIFTGKRGKKKNHLQTTYTCLQVTAEGYTPVTTQIFDKHAKYLEDDAVFAVKDDLLVEFVPRTGDPKASIQVEYNITLSPK